MKRVIKAASNKPNKTQLRSEFVRLATQIRDMSKYEFVQLLKNNDFATATEWIDKLNELYNEFSSQARSSINYVVAKVIVDGKFMGYVSRFKKQSGSRGWPGRSIVRVTDAINEASQFANTKEAEASLYKGNDIVVWTADDIGYKYEHGYSDRPEVAGTKDKLSSDINETDVFYAADIHFEFEEV